MVSEIVKIAGVRLNMALEAAANEPQPANRVFSPQNWVKTKTCLAGINGAIRNYSNMLQLMPGGADVKKNSPRPRSLSLRISSIVGLRTNYTVMFSNQCTYLRGRPVDVAARRR